MPRSCSLFDINILIQNQESIFWGFSGPEFQNLLSSVETKKFSTGQVLLKSKFRADSFVIVLKGSVNLMKGEYLFKQVLPGSIIGEVEYFLGMSRDYYLKCCEASELVVLSKKSIDNFFSNCSRDLETMILSNVIKILSDGLKKSNSRISNLLYEKNEAINLLREDLMSLSENGMILKKDFDFFYTAINTLKVNFVHEFLEEKRKADRYEVTRGLNLKMVSDLFFELSDIIDISETGCKVEVSEFFNVENGEVISGQILHDFSYFTDFSGELRWIEGNLVGIEFVKINSLSKKRLLELVQNLEEEKLFG